MNQVQTQTQATTQPHQTRLARPSFRAGWSLIELLVVVSLITVLLGIIINTAGEARGPEIATKILVQNAMAVATEYEAATGQFILSDGTSTPTASVQFFAQQASKTKASQQMLLNLGKEYITVDGAGNVTAINDAWGRSLWYVAYNAGETTSLPKHGKSANAPEPFFASMGGDGKWGTYDGQNKPSGDAADNIYSFELR